MEGQELIRVDERRTDIPVLILHNIDPAWRPEEQCSVIDAVIQLKRHLEKEGHPVVDVPVTSDHLDKILQPYRAEDWVVFNWCEELPGKPRSDGRVAESLERLSFTFTGSSGKVLSFSWDKPACKSLLHQYGVPTPSWKVIDAKEADKWSRFPAIVKPAYEHCSVGITSDAVVMDQQALRNRIDFVKDTFKQPAIVEDFIDGREFHVTIWGNGVISSLPVAEMDFAAFQNTRDRLCTFDSKFTPGSVHYEKIELRIPAQLNPEQVLRINQTAITAYQAMGCRDYARIDLRLDTDGGIYHVLDVNPNADFSPDTSMAYSAEAAGMSYGVFASMMIHLAAQRHPAFSMQTRSKRFKP